MKKIECYDEFADYNKGLVTLEKGRMTHRSYGNGPHEYVLRKDLGSALRHLSEFRYTLYVDTHGNTDANNRGLTLHTDGGFQFGCCTFAPKEATIIRKWALARPRKVKQSKKAKRG